MGIDQQATNPVNSLFKKLLLRHPLRKYQEILKLEVLFLPLCSINFEASDCCLIYSIEQDLCHNCHNKSSKKPHESTYSPYIFKKGFDKIWKLQTAISES